jgi:hypothetical protein
MAFRYVPSYRITGYGNIRGGVAVGGGGRNKAREIRRRLNQGTVLNFPYRHCDVCKSKSISNF